MRVIVGSVADQVPACPPFATIDPQRHPNGANRKSPKQVLLPVRKQIAKVVGALRRGIPQRHQWRVTAQCCIRLGHETEHRPVCDFAERGLGRIQSRRQFFVHERFMVILDRGLDRQFPVGVDLSGFVIRQSKRCHVVALPEPGQRRNEIVQCVRGARQVDPNDIVPDPAANLAQTALRAIQRCRVGHPLAVPQRRCAQRPVEAIGPAMVRAPHRRLAAHPDGHHK